MGTAESVCGAVAGGVVGVAVVGRHSVGLCVGWGVAAVVWCGVATGSIAAVATGSDTEA